MSFKRIIADMTKSIHKNKYNRLSNGPHDKAQLETKTKVKMELMEKLISLAYEDL